MQNKNDKIYNKSCNKNPIRILYKKAGELPDIKIINNVLILKRAIINNKLKLIPYEYGKILIICNNNEKSKYMKPNVVLTLDSVFGDLILVGFDKKKREFKTLSSEDIIWYTEDLINKSFNNM